ncbi:hypothetical protein [Lysobacter sp. A3-1-A15]|uniref:hypothetical protein n=1 Tax=Novilysobacter viscosus TaxID=3098602 RepID=UPI002EDAB395
MADPFLLAGAASSALAAVLHLACIVVGAPLYRWLGAGEGIAQMAEAGHWYPTAMALSIAGVLSVLALYALSGAGAIRRLPLLRTALCAITAVYLLRGLGFLALMPYFPGNSLAFWLVTSAICLVIGGVHLAGIGRRWAHLKPAD